MYHDKEKLGDQSMENLLRENEGGITVGVNCRVPGQTEDNRGCARRPSLSKRQAVTTRVDSGFPGLEFSEPNPAKSLLVSLAALPDEGAAGSAALDCPWEVTGAIGDEGEAARAWEEVSLFSSDPAGHREEKQRSVGFGSRASGEKAEQIQQPEILAEKRVQKGGRACEGRGGRRVHQEELWENARDWCGGSPLKC